MTSHNPEDILTEFYIDGEWTSTYGGSDLSVRVRGGDSIRLTAGGSDQFSSITSRASSYTLNNFGNLFTDDDPNSPLYRKFGQATRVRHTLLHSTRGYDLYARISDQPLEPNGTRIYTDDKASLDVTGDIDIRWEMEVRSTRDLRQVIAAKALLSAGNFSWLLWMTTDGRFSFTHSTDGNVGTLTTTSSALNITPENETRRAYRMTLDVNNGSGGRTYTWYTSDHIDGTWTQFSTSTVASTTSIASGAAALSLTAGGNGDIIIGSTYPFRGKLYAFRAYSGIAGTLVADFWPNQDALLGQDTWDDTCASPNTWVIENVGQADGMPAIRLGSDRVRFTGENQTRPDDWDPSAADRWCAMTAQGTLSRYQARTAEIKSTLRRYFTRQDGIVGYWACEDGQDATTAGSALDGGIPATLTECTFGDADGFYGSGGALELTDAGLSNAIMRAVNHAQTGAWSALFYFHVSELPASNAVIANIYPKNSSIHRWVININLTGFEFQAYSTGGSVVSSATSSYGTGVNPSTGWVAMYMAFEQVGTDIRWQTAWHQVGSATTFTHNPSGTTFAGTAGTINYIHFIPINASLDNMQVSQVVLFDYEYQITSAFGEISRGYSGETWGRRWLRLLTEEGVACDWAGDLDLTEECGPQRIDTLYSILQEGAKLDGGLVTEARDAVLRWTYVTGAALGNRRRLELSYSASEPKDVGRPTGDGRYTVNDFTATREDGASSRYEATDERRKNVREPDEVVSPGVGRIERGETYNAYEDERLYYIASNRVHLGTWDERHIPTMTVWNHRDQISGNAELHDSIFAQDIGDPISIVDTVAPMIPGDVHSIATGYTETLDNLTHSIEFSTVPQGPYDVPIVESENEEYEIRLAEENDETTLKSSLSSSATSFVIKTDATATAPFWVNDTDNADSIGGGQTLDMDIDGEIIRATSITTITLVSGFNEQTVTATRSINGVVKSHDAGAVVRLVDPSYLGRL